MPAYYNNTLRMPRYRGTSTLGTARCSSLLLTVVSNATNSNVVSPSYPAIISYDEPGTSRFYLPGLGRFFSPLVF
eukprot:scaffold26782_cov51-Attheya_sp.AAC.7